MKTTDKESKKYRWKTGVLFFGGCGENILRTVVDRLDPNHYQDFYLFAANTDAKVLDSHFGKTDENLKRWQDAKAFTPHQLGGDEVTGGTGAGADPEVGRLAAETEESQEAIKQFIESVNEVILVGGLGGGTGTGALPVAARIAKEANKTTYAVVVMPEPEEGKRRMRVAIDALEKIQKEIPTTVIRNSYLQEYMATLPEEEQEKLTVLEAWDIVNENSIFPILMITREIIQETGDVKNFDQADRKTVLKYGNHVLVGWADIEPAELKTISAEEIVKRLFAARFQDAQIVERGKVGMMWVHGPLPKKKFDEVRALAKAKICGGNLAKEEEFDLHYGFLQNVKDGKIWIAINVVTDSLDEAAAEGQKAETTKTKTASILPKTESEELHFKSGGKTVKGDVPLELGARYRRMTTGAGAHGYKLEEIQKLFEEIRVHTGYLPDLPERFHSATTH